MVSLKCTSEYITFRLTGEKVIGKVICLLVISFHFLEKNKILQMNSSRLAVRLPLLPLSLGWFCTSL